MPYYITIAFKNIFRQKKRSFTLGINYLLISIMLLFLFSLSAGLSKNIRENLVQSTAGHLTISGEYIVKGKTYQGVNGVMAVRDAAQTLFPDSVNIVDRYSLSSAVYFNGISKRLSFQGIEPSQDNGIKGQLTMYLGSWDDYVADNTGVLVPKEVAEYFNLQLGDELVLAARSRFGAFNTATMRVKGMYETANFFVQGVVIAHSSFIRNLDFASTDIASGVYLYFSDLENIEQKRIMLMDRLSTEGFKVKKPASSEDALAVISSASPRTSILAETVNESRLTIATVYEVIGLLSQILTIINAGGVFLASIMLFVIAVSIFINMRMTISERLQEIGTLRAMGVATREIVRMFMFENVFLSILFVMIGIVCGLAIMGLIVLLLRVSPTGVIGLLFDDGRLVLSPGILEMMLIVVVLAVFTAIFSYFPARYGGKIRAVEALTKTM